MEKGKIQLTQKDAENTPAGGVVVGKRDGQTMIYDDASLGGYFVGKLHRDGGIKMINKSTGQPLEVQGSEVIITAPAVNDQTKREFEGKMMTNREILSKINSDGGGVSFADGGDIPAKIHTTDKEYEYGGKMVHDTDIAHSLGMNSTLKKGKQQFSSGDSTYDVDAIYNAIKKGKLRLKTKEVETFPMKYPVYDKKYAENHKIDFRKPNGITVRTESGEEVLIDGNHRMNNAYLNGRKTMKTYYIEDPKQIAKFTKKNKFELGGENKMGGHLSKGKSLKKIAEMHNVSLAHINEELAKGLEVEKEHFSDFKERTRVAKDHLVENPNYYTILEKAGLKMGGEVKEFYRRTYANGTFKDFTLEEYENMMFNGGHIQKQELVENSKKGDTPARDLNNYNDVLDLEADGVVGMQSGLAFADGGITPIDANIEGDSVDIVENGFADGGGVELPIVSYVTVSGAGSSLEKLIGNKYNSYIEFAESVEDAYKQLGKKVRSFVQLQAFDENSIALIDVSTYISDQKNTILNFNPLTGNYKNLEKSLQKSRPRSFQKFNWENWLLSKVTPSSSGSGQPLSLSKTKVWLGEDYKQNSELSKKIQEKAFELGWGWFINGRDKKIKENIEPQAFYFNDKNEMTYSSGISGREYFDKNEDKELTPEEILSIPSPNSTQASASNYEDTVDSIIVNYKKFNAYIATDVEKLLDEIKRLWRMGGRSEMEITLQPQNVNGLLDNTFYLKLDTVSNGIFTIEPDNISLYELKELLLHFYALDWDKFFEVPVFSNASTSAKPFDFSMTKIDVSNNPELSVKVQKKAFEDGWEWENGGGKTIDYNTFNFLYFTKTSVSYGNNPKSFINSPKREITEAEIFGSQAPASNKKIVDYIIVKEPRSFPDGEKVYRGSGLLPLLKEIYKNSPIENIKVEIDLVVNGQAEDAPLTLTLTGVPTYSDYEINPNDISEQILYSKLKLDWFPEYNWDRLFPLIELLDFYLEDSYLPNYTTKNINELFSKLNAPEVKSSNKEITLTWFGENGETHKFGAYFTNDATVYYQIDRDNFTLDLLRGKLDDWFYGRLSESYMFPDGQVKAKKPTSNSAVPKTVEQGVYNLDLAVSKLEKASSVVVTEYNKEVYDKTLKFLYDTKATYELALKFTPESAFMYERLDILKKLADIEKKIKNIEDMKKGGAFYMLAKILEKLERGENWKQSETAQEVITNAIPQSEIDIIIRSQKFKNWFGDWEKALVNDEYDNVSKALTDGIPSVYHHGARRIKYTYREVSNGVLYLAENISYAMWFSQNATAQSEEGNYLTECFVNVKNPIDLTAFHVNKVDLGDIVRYVNAVYPMAKIYDFIPAQVALLIKTNQPTNVRMWAWQLIRSYAKFVNHIKENTPYDGFLYYENNPSDEVTNPVTGQLEENVTKAVAIFKSHQVKVVDAVLFDGGLDDWRFENGGKIKN